MRARHPAPRADRAAAAPGRAAGAAAHGLARDRPRCAARATSGSCGRWSGRASAWSPSSRPTPTGMVRCPSPSRSRPRAPTACRWPPSTRRWSCARRGSRCPARAVPGSAASGHVAPRPAGIAVALGPGVAASTGCSRRRLPRSTRVEPPLDVHVEVETGLGRGGALPGDVGSVVGAVLDAPGVRLAGIWTHLAAADDAASARGQGARFGAALERLAGQGLVPDAIAIDGARARRHLAASGAVLGAAVLRWDAVRTGLAVYGLLPDALSPPPATAEAAGSPATRPWRSWHAPSASWTCRPGHGVSYGPTYRDHPDDHDRDAARRLRRRVAACVVGSVGSARPRAAGAARGAGGHGCRDGERHRRRRSAGDRGRRVRAARPAGRPRRSPPHELASTCGTISYEVVTGMSRRLPRVYHAADSPVEVRILAGGRSEWRASSSGTGTSATSRSTRS